MRVALALATLGISSAGVLGQELELCGTQRAELATTTSQLRDIKDICDIYTDGYARALHRLNTFPLPDNLPKVTLRRQIPNVQMSRVVLEADVFFNLLESYPIDIGLTKLAELVGRINDGFLIERLWIVGSVDPRELKMPSLQVASHRADFLRKYFTAAGVDPARISVDVRGPTHEDTLQGRARDRSIALRVVMLRQSSQPAQ